MAFRPPPIRDQSSPQQSVLKKSRLSWEARLILTMLELVLPSGWVQPESTTRSDKRVVQPVCPSRVRLQLRLVRVV